MQFVPSFFLSVFGVAEELHHNPARMRVIVRRSYAHLENRLRRAFEGRADVEVIGRSALARTARSRPAG